MDAPKGKEEDGTEDSLEVENVVLKRMDSGPLNLVSLPAPRTEATKRIGLLTLGSILTDPLKAKYFLEFLEQEHSDEMFLFYRDVDHYRKEKDAQKRAVLGKKIFDVFIAETGEHQVFITFPVVQAIKKDIAQEQWNARLFDDAQLEIVNALRCDNFGRFCCSALYDVMHRSLGNRDAIIDPVVFHTFLSFCKNEDPRAWIARNGGGDVQVWNWIPSITSKESLVVKTKVRVACAGARILDVVSCPEKHRAAFDASCTEATVIERFDDNFKVIYLRHTWNHVDRCSIVGQIHRRLDNGWCLLYRSVDWPDDLLSPRTRNGKKSLVRSEVSMAGYLIEELGPDECMVTHLIQEDLTVRVSQSEMTKFTQSRVDAMMSMRNYILSNQTATKK